MDNIYVGMKYYKFINEEDEDPIILKLVRIKNTNLYVLQDENGNKIKLNKTQLSEFVPLTPDALLVFCVVGLAKTAKDVVVSMYKYKELEEGIIQPYAVCRQNLIDLFSQATNRNSVITYIGCSVSRDTCPPDVDFNIALVCDNISYDKKVVAYMDDTLDDILNLISASKFDSAMEEFYTYIDRTMFDGAKRTLRELLLANDFMYDFHKAFKIEDVSFKITKDQYNEKDDLYILNTEQVECIEKILKVQVTANIVFKYNKNINIDSITKAYILICDSSKTIYLVAYVPGRKINREYDAMEDKRDEELLKNQMK